MTLAWLSGNSGSALQDGGISKILPAFNFIVFNLLEFDNVGLILLEGQSGCRLKGPAWKLAQWPCDRSPRARGLADGSVSYSSLFLLLTLNHCPWCPLSPDSCTSPSPGRLRCQVSCGVHRNVLGSRHHTAAYRRGNRAPQLSVSGRASRPVLSPDCGTVLMKLVVNCLRLSARKSFPSLHHSVCWFYFVFLLMLMHAHCSGTHHGKGTYKTSLWGL